MSCVKLENIISEINLIIHCACIFIIYKNGNKLVHYNPRLNEQIQDLLKDMSTILIDITLQNNIFSLKVNKFKLINYKFINNANHITNAKIFDITNDNKFIDLLIK